MRLAIILAAVLTSVAADTTLDHRAPAGTRTAMRRPGAHTILPGGKIIEPLGLQYHTGPGPFGLAVNPKGSIVVSADGGPQRYSITVLEKRKERWRVRQYETARSTEHQNDEDWRSVFMGLAFQTERELFASEGNSGRVRLLDPLRGKTRWLIDLNQGEYRNSYTGDLAYDEGRHLLYVVDQANFR